LIAMMSRAEFQCAHCVDGVRERPWTWVAGGVEAGIGL
jgi:hypothetical protein